MPAKKSTKRGKATTKAENMSAPENTNPLSNTDEQKSTANMNATFIVGNISNGEKSNNGLPGCGDADGVDNVVGNKNEKCTMMENGDAKELDDIEEDEAMETSPPKNTKGKTGSKKNKLVEHEPESGPAEDEVSPKRALEEDEEMVEEPPSKRREKATKKVTTSRRDRKAKVEHEVMATEENTDENTFPEEMTEGTAVEQVPTKRVRGGKVVPAAKRGRKGKGDVEFEPSEEKPKTKVSSPGNDSPVEMDGDEDAEDVDDVKEDSKPAKKRTGRVTKEKPALEPSTRATRSRKQVTYAEGEEDEEHEHFTNKKVKKTTASKKPPSQSRKPKEVAQKPVASTKRKGRALKAPTEMKKEEEAEE